MGTVHKFNQIYVPSQSYDVNIELVVYVIKRLMNPDYLCRTGGLDLTLNNLEPSTFRPAQPMTKVIVNKI